MRYRCRHSRRGIAATELAVLLPFLLILLVGLWEVGRYIMIQNILDSAAREAGRLGASGAFFSSTNHTRPTAPNGPLVLPSPSTNSDYELQKKVSAYLQTAGVGTTGMTVTVTNKGTSGSPKNWSYTWAQAGGSTGSGFDPTAAAGQLDRLDVVVTLPYQNVTWSPLSWFVGHQATMIATTSWFSVTDTPLIVSTIIPSQPLLPSDPLP
jgi:TadE-like protein